MTGIVLRGRPDAGPVRAAISARADKIECLHALANLRRKVVLEQNERRPVAAGQRGPDMPGGLCEGGGQASFGDDSQVPGLRTGGQPDAQVGNTFLAMLIDG